MVHNATGDSDSVDNHFREAAASRLSIANNVITKRREQLKQWEDSEMNKLAAVRQPIDRSKVKFHDSDVFMSVCDSGDEEEIDDLLEKGANINTTTIDGVTALHQAVIDGKIDTIKLLLDKGADINAQDYEGWTPLHAAVCCGSLPIVKLLCEKNADLTLVNSDKELAVDLAEDDEIKEYLEEQLKEQNIDAEECRDREFNTMMKDCTEWIRCGKYLDKPHPRTGATALHVAASKGYNQLIGMLIRAGANVYAKDAEGWTPLHAAAHWGEKDACRILIENGAKVTEKNFADQDVLRVADKSIVEYLEGLQKSLEKTSAKPSNVHISQSASHVLQPTTNTPPAQLKRSSVPRLSTDEKISIKKKDEHDENLSLALGIDVPSIRSPSTPPPLSSPSPVALTALKVDSPERSASPPPPKKPTLGDPANPPESGNVIFKSYKQEKTDSASSLSSQQSNPSVVAVLPAPRVSNQESVSYSSNSSLTKSGSNSSASSSTSSVARISTAQPASPSMTAAILATQKLPPAPISRTPRVIQIPTTSERKAPMGEEEDLEEEEEEEDEQLNTGSGVSSIRDYSRSITKDSSSNISSSNQSIDSTTKISGSKPEKGSSSTASSSTPKPYWSVSYSMDNAKKTPAVISSSTNVTTTRVVSPTASENSGNSPLTSPTVQFKKPSWQTPPTQPVPQKESEAERKAKSRLQRQSRRSTQGVTAEQLNEARAASEDIGKWRSATLQQTSVTNNPAQKRSDDEGFSSAAPYLSISQPPAAINTPSANKFRRSQIVRANRRGTGPVDYEALSAATNSDEADSNDNKFANVTVRKRSDDKTFITPSKTYQESQQNTTSVIHGPIVANPPRTGSGGIASISSSTNGSVQNGPGDKYKQLYEKERAENEKLRKMIEQMNMKSGDLSNGTSRPNSSMDDHDKRTLERKIAQLEYELEKAKQLQSDYKRLKDENGALIRVISKLSTK